MDCLLVHLPTDLLQMFLCELPMSSLINLYQTSSYWRFLEIIWAITHDIKYNTTRLPLVAARLYQHLMTVKTNLSQSCTAQTGNYIDKYLCKDNTPSDMTLDQVLDLHVPVQTLIKFVLTLTIPLRTIFERHNMKINNIYIDFSGVVLCLSASDLEDIRFTIMKIYVDHQNQLPWEYMQPSLDRLNLYSSLLKDVAIMSKTGGIPYFCFSNGKNINRDIQLYLFQEDNSQYHYKISF